ncbi:MAG: LCP family protein [Ruminococcus sp.]|nr:LCP family protein [Ruminococcus sp.]
MSNAKKKKSQAPVALVYTITLLVFMAVFGYIAYRLILQMDSWKKDETTSEINTDPSFNLMFARVSQKGALTDAAVIRFSPKEDKVIIVPITAYTVTGNDGSTLAEVYEKGGIRQLEKSVENVFGIKVDNYMTVSTPAFETVCDIIGGIVYTPQEDLYKLFEKDADDISYQAGKAVDMTGHQITQLLGENVFSAGWSGNLDFLGNVLEQLANNAFQQANFTKTCMDNLYSQLTGNGETDYTRNEYTENKSTLNEMLDKHLNKPAVLLMPEGEWRESARFLPATTYINDLKEVFGGNASKAAARIDANSSAAQTDLSSAAAPGLEADTKSQSGQALVPEDNGDDAQNNEPADDAGQNGQ